MNYFDFESTNEIVSLEDKKVQRELEKLSYEKYLREEAFTRKVPKKKNRKKRRYNKKKREK